MTSSRFARSVLCATVAGLSLFALGPVGAGQAAQTYTTAKVVRVVDGDTIKVDYDGDGRWDDAIRLIGIDSPEHDRCGYDAATRALKSLVGHKVVGLASDTGQTGRQNRPERRVIVPVGGQSVDATTWMLERGHGVWMPRKGETTNSLAHHRGADAAAAVGVGWFDEDRCGAGPAPEGSLSMRVQYLADAAYKLSVADRRNQEFIRIRNGGPAPLSMDGWTLRVGNDRRELIPAGGPVPAGETLTVHVGSGINTVLHRYIGSAVTMLVDANLGGGPHVGGGSYLIDPDGDIRASATWPCATNCGDPTTGSLVLSEVTVNPAERGTTRLNSETIQLTNVGSAPVLTADLVIEVSPWVYEFPPDHLLNPGETVVVRGGAGQDDRLNRFLDARNPPLPDGGGRVLVRTFDSVIVDCFSWGTGGCPAGS
jgi:micrococcal nuclease